MEKSNHSTPGDAFGKDIPGHLHKDVLSTVALNLVDQSERNKGKSLNVGMFKKATEYTASRGKLITEDTLTTSTTHR